MNRFKGLVYESKERDYWAEDDWRWGTRYTTRVGHWLLAFTTRLIFGRGYIPKQHR